MKLIFLDIDGVINNNKHLMTCQRNDDSDMFMPELVERVNSIIDATKAKVVISSDWRLCDSSQQIYRWLCAKGFRGEVIGATPSYAKRMDGDRGDEIREWLDTNAPDATFVILDDINHVECVKDRLVLTDFNKGLTDENVQQAIEMLTR